MIKNPNCHLKGEEEDEEKHVFTCILYEYTEAMKTFHNDRVRITFISFVAVFSQHF